MHSNIYGDINNSNDKQDRKVMIEHVIVKCKDTFTAVIDNNKELCFDYSQQDKAIPAARGYFNLIQDQ